MSRLVQLQVGAEREREEEGDYDDHESKQEGGKGGVGGEEREKDRRVEDMTRE